MTRRHPKVLLAPVVVVVSGSGIGGCVEGVTSLEVVSTSDGWLAFSVVADVVVIVVLSTTGGWGPSPTRLTINFSVSGFDPVIV